MTASSKPRKRLRRSILTPAGAKKYFNKQMKKLSDSFDIKPSKEELFELRNIVLNDWESIGLNPPDAASELAEFARLGSTFDGVKKHAESLVKPHPMTGPAMRRIRVHRKLTQAAMAKVLRLGANGDRTIRRWESGDWQPGRQVVLLYEMLADGRLKPDRVN